MFAEKGEITTRFQKLLCGHMTLETTHGTCSMFAQHTQGKLCYREYFYPSAVAVRCTRLKHPKTSEATPVQVAANMVKKKKHLLAEGFFFKTHTL